MDAINLVLPLIAIAVAALLLLPAIKESTVWRASVTPLASIIGSGFLVVAPLLALVVGWVAPLAMLAIVVIAYGLGEISRFNIRYGEPLLQSGEAPALLVMTERVANLALSLAYIVSVAFYIRLLASFVFRGVGLNTEIGAQVLTTLILIFIGYIGWRRGLEGLVRVEEYSVSIKLAIIVALLFGLANYDASVDFSIRDFSAPSVSAWEQLRQLAGMLLVVQGFETSRYLGSEFSAELRIKSMRFAQVVSGLIYVAFIIMCMPLLLGLDGLKVDETAIIGLSGHVAMVLPAMLVLAATMSQFSAAVADTAGAGGLVEEESRGRIPVRYAHVAVIGLGIVLVWTTNVFEIIALASRAFAAYYLSQALTAFQLAGHRPEGRSRRIGRIAMALAAVLLVWVVIFAVPAD